MLNWNTGFPDNKSTATFEISISGPEKLSYFIHSTLIGVQIDAERSPNEQVPVYES